MSTEGSNNGSQNGAGANGGAAGASGAAGAAAGDQGKAGAAGAAGDQNKNQAANGAGDQGKTGPLAAALGADGKPAAQPVAVDYDKLDLKKPEGYKGADSDLAFARNMAKNLGLSAEAAQKFVDEHAKVIAADDEAVTRETAQTRADNIATLKADAEFGGAKFNESITRADQWLAKYDPNGELAAELKSFGLDTHPTLVRAFMRAARDMADGTTFVQAKPGDNASQAASLSEFYPSMK